MQILKTIALSVILLIGSMQTSYSHRDKIAKQYSNFKCVDFQVYITDFNFINITDDNLLEIIVSDPNLKNTKIRPNDERIVTIPSSKLGISLACYYSFTGELGIVFLVDEEFGWWIDRYSRETKE